MIDEKYKVIITDGHSEEEEQKQSLQELIEAQKTLYKNLQEKEQAQVEQEYKMKYEQLLTQYDQKIGQNNYEKITIINNDRMYYVKRTDTLTQFLCQIGVDPINV